MKTWILAALFTLMSATTWATHVQWETNGLPDINPPKYNPAVEDPDRGVPLLKERRVVLRGLTMDFKRIGHVQVEVFNNTMDVAQKDAWVEIEDIIVVTGFAKAKRADGLRRFYIEGNGPIMLDIVMKVSPQTDSGAIDVKVSTPYIPRN